MRAETAQLTDGLERSLLNLEVPIRTKADSGSCSVFLFFFLLTGDWIGTIPASFIHHPQWTVVCTARATRRLMV